MSDTCVGDLDRWPCFVAGFAEPVAGTVLVTIQETGETAEEYGAVAARAIWTLIDRDTAMQLKFVQTVDAEGGPLSIVSRGEIPTLN